MLELFKYLEGRKLALREALVLTYIVENPGRSTRDIAPLVGKSVSVAARRIGHLKTRGLVACKPTPADGRLIACSPTRSGTALVEQMRRSLAPGA